MRTITVRATINDQIITEPLKKRMSSALPKPHYQVVINSNNQSTSESTPRLTDVENQHTQI